MRIGTVMEASDLNRRLTEFCQAAAEVQRELEKVTDQQVRHWIVNPFLTALGWDPHDKHSVFLDFPVAHGRPVDYALLDADGKPKLFLEVRARNANVHEAGEVADAAKATGVPLVLLTNGSMFSLWYAGGTGAASVLFSLALDQLPGYADGLVGLTADYRLSESGIHELRRSALRLAALRMLDQNAEKTFDALVAWVQSQVAPGELDATTEEAIQDATMLWLTEEHARLPGFASADGKRVQDLRPTTPKDWESFPQGPPGTFRYKYDTAKTLDLRQPAKEVREQMRLQGLKTPSATAFGGFYHALRVRAGLGRAEPAASEPRRSGGHHFAASETASASV
jgi:hypothetical protein